jgi:hypothetical protein
MIIQAHFRGKMIKSTEDYLRKQYIPDIVNRCNDIWKNKKLPYKMRQFALEVHAHLKIISGGSIGNTFENDIMKLIFNATAIANIADNAAASPLTNLYASLHTADPGETGDQTTSETTYTSYARVAVARTSGGFTVTNNSVSPVAAITFPAGTGGSGTVTHAAIGTASAGAGKLLFSGTVTPNIVTGNGVTPSLPTSSTITID